MPGPSPTQVPALPEPRSHHATIKYGSGSVLVAGGLDKNYNVLSSCYYYDTVANQWFSAGTLPTGSYNLQAITSSVLSNTVLLVGGITAASASLNGAWAWDGSTRAFTDRSSGMIFGGQFFQLTEYSYGPSGGFILKTGGCPYASDYATNLVEYFDPYNLAWNFSFTPNRMKLPRAGHMAVVLRGGKIWIGGGFDRTVPTFGGFGHGITTVGNYTYPYVVAITGSETYYPPTDTWEHNTAYFRQPQTGLKQGIAFGQAFLVGTGSVLIIPGAANVYMSGSIASPSDPIGGRNPDEYVKGHGTSDGFGGIIVLDTVASQAYQRYDHSDLNGLNDFTYGVANHCFAAQLDSGDVLFVGGIYANPSYSSAWSYKHSVSRNTIEWMTSSLLNRRRWDTSNNRPIVLSSGLLIAGGRDDPGKYTLGSCEFFDFASSTWTISHDSCLLGSSNSGLTLALDNAPVEGIWGASGTATYANHLINDYGAGTAIDESAFYARRYAFTLPVSTDVTAFAVVNLDDTSEDDPALYILNTDESIVAETWNDTLSSPGMAAGDYYVEIVSTSPRDTGRFTLALSASYNEDLPEPEVVAAPRLNLAPDQPANLSLRLVGVRRLRAFSDERAKRRF